MDITELKSTKRELENIQNYMKLKIEFNEERLPFKSKQVMKCYLTKTLPPAELPFLL